MRSLFSAEQLKMVQSLQKLLLAKNFTEAAALCDEMMSSILDHNSEAYVYLLMIKLQCILSTQEIERAEAVCLDFLQQDIRKEQKLKVIDGFACQILYQPSPFLKQAERFARMGLEIAPGTLTLKGTLGSILVEQGNYSEAEPLLVECLDRSPALHDRAIASFYLGMIKVRTGELGQGKRLIKRGMKMYPEAWMVEKGNMLLQEARA
jgi:tetratricopeptide (TPR) repeat protein